MGLNPPGLWKLYHWTPTWQLRERRSDLAVTMLGDVPAKYAKYQARARADAKEKIDLITIELWARGAEHMQPPTDPMVRATYERMFKRIWQGDTAADRQLRRQRIVEEIAGYEQSGEQEYLLEARWCLALLDQVIAEVDR